MVRRKADRMHDVMVGTVVALVETWFDMSEESWDGCEPLDAGAEVFDVLVRASVIHFGQVFEAFASLGMVAVMPGDGYLDQVEGELTEQVTTALRASVLEDASGVGVERAKNRAAMARNLARKFARKMRAADDVLSHEERTAVRRYALMNGRCWKAELRRDERRGWRDLADAPQHAGPDVAQQVPTRKVGVRWETEQTCT